MKQFRVKKWIGALCAAVGIAVFFRPVQVYAENAEVTFGSDSYTKESNEQFQIGVYIRGDTGIGTYYVEMEYDTTRMEYLGGADDEQDGVIILRGTGLREEVKYMLDFHSIGGGEAGISVRYADIQTAEGNGGEDFEVVTLGYAPVSIEGDDESGVPFPDNLSGHENAESDSNAGHENAESGSNAAPGTNVEPGSNAALYGIETDIPILAAVDMKNEETLYIVDHSQYVPPSADWNYSIWVDSYEGRRISFLTNAERTVRLLYLMDGEENFYLYAYSDEKDLLYRCYEFDREGKTYYYMSAYACSVWPAELNLQAIKEDYVFYAMDKEGSGGFYRFDSEGNLTEWNADQSETSDSVQTRKLIYIVLAAMILLLIVCIGAYRAARIKKRRRRQKYQQYKSLEKRLEERKKREQLDLEFPIAGLHEPEKQERKASAGEKKEQPVISVQDVTMVFHISTGSASGIKEYLIQWLKHQVTYRELVALDHISFDVFKGEVVGIIGTNGSGKSTLLRIVSGALNPTGGQVLVDRRKVQLLTLGTGFDMELSARENVYLNGSMIGYSKEFLDTHYDEIVAFAELEDFMEEKVKNFSSGMVSRLGFAIATAGDAAEILILDEVLSVGDEFFRKKSLKRIKEMIHGGSTVLMVSHGMGTILENCTKVVWIEKGKMQMVGEAKEVCAAYEKMNKTGD